MGALTRLSLRYPAATLSLLAAFSAALALGLGRLSTDVGYRAFLGTSHPAVREFDRFLERFGGGLPLAAVWSCRESPACERVFDPASLGMAHAVARALETTPGVRRVDGPATSPLLAPELFDLPRARRLAPAGTPVSDLDTLAALALEDPLWVGQLVSEDGTAGALIAQLESSDGETSRRVFAAFDAALARVETDGFRFSLVGGPVEFVVAGGELEANAARIVPLMVGLVAMILLVLFSSWIAALVALGTVGLAVLWTFGAMGWLGWPQNSLAQAIAPLVLVIGVCDAIHVLARYAAQPEVRDPGASPPDPRPAALVRVSEEVGPPCVMTTLTTAAGFASFAVSRLESIARFGLLAAIGVVAALALTFTLLPIVLARLPRHRVCGPAAGPRWERALGAIARLAARRRGAVLALAAVAGAICAFGSAELRVDASFEDLYGEHSRVVRWARAVASQLRAPDTLEIALEPPQGADLASPGVLAVAGALQAELEPLPGLGRSRSISDPMRRLNALLHREALVFEGSGGSLERNASLLRLLRAEDLEGVDLFVDRADPALRLSFEADKLPQDRLRALLGAVERRVAALPPGWSATVTGPLQLVRVMIDEIRATQLASFALAGGLVLALVALYFRSLALAALAMVPTVFPVLLTLGSMGLAGVALDVGTAMVAAVVLGIAVDAAIHVLVPYRRRRRAGDAAAVAIAAAVRYAGRAIATSSLALTLGFLVLVLSPWKSIASFGLVASIAILGSLFAALLLLPALLTGDADV